MFGFILLVYVNNIICKSLIKKVIVLVYFSISVYRNWKCERILGLVSVEFDIFGEFVYVDCYFVVIEV